MQEAPAGLISMRSSIKCSATKHDKARKSPIKNSGLDGTIKANILHNPSQEGRETTSPRLLPQLAIPVAGSLRRTTLPAAYYGSGE